jgi:hypothetical protein
MEIKSLVLGMTLLAPSGAIAAPPTVGNLNYDYKCAVTMLAYMNGSQDDPKFVGAAGAAMSFFIGPHDPGRIRSSGP